MLRKSWWLCWENHWLVPLLCLFQLFTSGGRHRTGRVIDLVPHDAGGGNGWSTKPALPHFLDTLNRNDNLISEATGRDIDNRFEKSGVVVTAIVNVMTATMKSMSRIDFPN